jgi:hypothetical protein
MSEENPLLAQLPEDLRAEPSLATIKDVGTLAKGYVNAQRLIGAKRLVAPQDSWGESQWNEFYDGIGRPKTPTDYKLPDVKLEEGVALDDTRKAATLAHLHKLGLTQRQATGVLEHYLNSVNEDVKSTRTKVSAASTSAEAALKQEWGDKFDTNLDIARSVIKKFGGEQATEMSAWLEASGLGNNVNLVRLFHKIGSEFQEDQRREGGQDTLPLGDQARAVQEIEQLKMDKDFQSALGDARNPGHKPALDRWLALYKVAFPGKEAE